MSAHVSVKAYYPLSELNVWTDTGVDVEENTILKIAASGKIFWGGVSSSNVNDPDGFYWPDGSPYMYYQSILTTAPVAALIGRIGTNGPIFFVGTDYEDIPPM